MSVTWTPTVIRYEDHIGPCAGCGLPLKAELYPAGMPVIKGPGGWYHEPCAMLAKLNREATT